jgi:hypothetical protein
MKKFSLIVLTAFAVITLALAVFPASVKADAPEFPAGTYVATITADDVAQFPLEFQGLLIGNWQIVYRPDGTFTVENLTIGLSADGTYVAAPSLVIFGHEAGALACKYGDGVFQWAFNGNTLTFTAVSDTTNCMGRKAVLVTHPWTKLP